MYKLFIKFLFLVLCSSLLSIDSFAQGKISRPSTQKSKSIKKPAKISQPDGYINGVGYIDLGLPSGTKWAIYNIGAEKIIEKGLYFSWGDTMIKESYIYNESPTINKEIDDISGSEEFDTAQLLWGNPWKMPTKEQWHELISKCKTRTFSLEGVKGLLVTGLNNKTLFLPYGGRKLGKYPDGFFNGFYWTSNADYTYRNSGPGYPDNAYATVLNLGHGRDLHKIYFSCEWRGEGYNIRAVFNK